MTASPFIHADPVHTFGVVNDSAAPVIVRFASRDQGFLVPPGGGGIAAQGFGYLEGPIDVLDAACHVMQSVVVTAQRAVVVIAPDRVARLVETDDMPTGNLSRTDQCAE